MNVERREQSASFIFTMILYSPSQHLYCSEGSCCAKTASSECRGALTAVSCSFQPHDYHYHHLQEKFVTERCPASSQFALRSLPTVHWAVYLEMLSLGALSIPRATLFPAQNGAQRIWHTYTNTLESHLKQDNYLLHSLKRILVPFIPNWQLVVLGKLDHPPVTSYDRNPYPAMGEGVPRCGIIIFIDLHPPVILLGAGIFDCIGATN